MMKINRKFTAFLILTMLANLFTGIGMLVTAEDGKDYIFRDTFENLTVSENNLTGLAGYYFDQNGGTRTIVYDPQNNGNKVAKFTKGSGLHKTLRWYEPRPAGTFTTELKVMLDSFDAEWGFQLRKDPPVDEYDIVTFETDGTVRIGSTNSGKALNINTWYNFSIEVNDDANTARVFIDGVQVGDTVTLKGSFKDSGKTYQAFAIKSYHQSGLASIYIDDFCAYRGDMETEPEPTPTPTPPAEVTYFFKDTFEDLTVSDNNLSGLNGYHFDQNDGTRTVVVDPHNSNNKAVKLTKTGNNLKTLRWYEPRPTGLFTTELKVMLDSFDSQWSLQFRMDPFQEYDIVTFENRTGVVRVGSESSSKVLEANKWYTVSMEVNTDTNTCRVFVDGVQVGSTVTLPDSFKDSGRTYHAFSINNNYSGSSSLYIDDVAAYQGGVEGTEPEPEPTPTPTPTPTPPPEVTYFFKDTFEDLTVSDNNLSGLNGYHFDQNDGTRTVVVDPHNSNNKAVKLTKTGNNLKTLRWYEPRPTGLFTTELKVMLDSFDSQWSLQFRMDPFQEYDIVTFENRTGVVRVGSESSSKVLEANKWYTVSMEVNTDTNTCRVFVDGVQVGSTVTLPDSFKDSGRTYHAFSINNNYTGSSSLYIDDVAAYQGGVEGTEPEPEPTPTPTPPPTEEIPGPTPEPQNYLFFHNYEELNVGNLTSLSGSSFDQNDGTREVVFDPDNSSNKVIKFTKGTAGSAHKTIFWYTPKPTGVFTTQLKARFDSFNSIWGFQLRAEPYAEQDLLNIESSGDEGVLVVGPIRTSKTIKANTWYTFSFVVDTDNLTCTIYLDGVQVAQTFSLDAQKFKENGSVVAGFNIKNYNTQGSSSIFFDDFCAYSGYRGLDAIKVGLPDGIQYDIDRIYDIPIEQPSMAIFFSKTLMTSTINKQNIKIINNETQQEVSNYTVAPNGSNGIRISFNGTLVGNTEYKIVIGQEVKSEDGFMLPSEKTILFTTEDVYFNVEAQMTNLKGEALTKIRPNSTVKVTVQVTNNSTIRDRSGKMIVAVYNKNDELVNLAFVSRQLSAGERDTYTAGFNLPNDVDGYKIKAFVASEFSVEKAVSNIVVFSQ